VLVALVLMYIGTGCGPATATSATGTTAPGTTSNELSDADAPPIDWDNPIGGVKVSLNVGIQDMPFVVQIPKDLSNLVGVLETISTKKVPEDFHQLALVFDDPTYGRIVVIEHHPSISAEEYPLYMQSMASYDGTDLMVGHAKIVKYDDGREALVESLPDETRSSVNCM
jgi:hypothetical protein